MLTLLKRRGVSVNVVTSQTPNRGCLSEIEELGIPIFKVPCRRTTWYPDLALESCSDLIRSSDLVWITDVEYPTAPRVKRIDKTIPVIAHLQSYALACPIWSAFYGMRETCVKNCSVSLKRFASCKELDRQYRTRWHEYDARMNIYQLLNLPKSWLDFTFWRMKRSFIDSIDAFIACSSYVRDLIRVHLPQLKDVPIEVIHNPVGVSRPEGTPDRLEDRSKKMILYASGGRMTKGAHIALYAIRKLLDQGYDELTLTMLATEGVPWIRGLVSRLSIERHVSLLPKLQRSLVLGMMANCEALLLPSLWPEPFGNVSVEANLMGAPALVSNRGGLPETIVDKVTGLLAEPTVDAIADSLVQSLRTDWNRELIARKTRERFDPERTAEQLINFLELVAARGADAHKIGYVA